MQDTCISNKKTIKCIKTNSIKVSDAKDTLISHDNENEVTFILMTVSNIFHSATTEPEKMSSKIRFSSFFDMASTMNLLY